jgi:hypothetical protein
MSDLGPSSRRGHVALVCVTVGALVLAVACSASGAPSAGLTGPTPGPSATSAAVPSGGLSAASASEPDPTSAGPTPLAGWIEHQGFGGSSGINQVTKATAINAEDVQDVTLFYLDDDAGLVSALISWLDTHPATGCWADLHANTRELLKRIAVSYAKARPVVAAGDFFPSDVAETLQADGLALKALVAPADCP